MLNFKNIENVLQKYNYKYENNIVCGTNKVKTNAVIPIGPVMIYSYNKIYNYYFRFSDEGINFIRIKTGTFDEVEDNTLLSWDLVKDLKIKKGLLTNSLTIITENAKLEYVFNKFVAGNEWVKENIEHLNNVNYYFKK